MIGMQRIAQWILGQDYGEEYIDAARERFLAIDFGRFPKEYDDVILTHHVGSANKEANLFKVKTRILLTRDFVIRHVEGALSEKTVLDVGGSSELFFSLFGVEKGKGTSVNFSEVDVRRMKAQGYDSVQVNSDQLPFPDASFDYCFSFECLEHTRSPLHSLSEMSRVARVGAFVSIPYRETSRVVRRVSGASPAIQHIFELSPQDLGLLAEHAGMSLTAYETPALEAAGGNPFRQLIRKRKGWGMPSLTLAYLKKQA